MSNVLSVVFANVWMLVLRRRYDNLTKFPIQGFFVRFFQIPRSGMKARVSQGGAQDNPVIPLMENLSTGALHVEYIVKQIKKGKLTPMEGANRLIKPCVCGIGNSKRTAQILSKMIQS